MNNKSKWFIKKYDVFNDLYSYYSFPNRDNFYHRTNWLITENSFNYYMIRKNDVNDYLTINKSSLPALFGIIHTSNKNKNGIAYLYVYVIVYIPYTI